MAASRVQSPFVFTDAGLAPPGLIAVSALPQNGGPGEGCTRTWTVFETAASAIGLLVRGAQGGICTRKPLALDQRGLLVSITCAQIGRDARA